MYPYSTSTIVKGNSHDLLKEAFHIPEDTQWVVTVENSVRTPKMRILLETTNDKEYAQSMFDSIDISEQPGFMKHLMSIDTFIHWVIKVYKVRVELGIDEA